MSRFQVFFFIVFDRENFRRLSVLRLIVVKEFKNLILLREFFSRFNRQFFFFQQVHLSLREKICFKGILFFAPPLRVCFLFLSLLSFHCSSFHSRNSSLSLIYAYFFSLFPSHTACNFFSSFFFHRWNAYFRSVHDYSQEIYSLILTNNQQIRK